MNLSSEFESKPGNVRTGKGPTTIVGNKPFSANHMVTNSPTTMVKNQQKPLTFISNINQPITWLLSMNVKIA